MKFFKYRNESQRKRNCLTLSVTCLKLSDKKICIIKRIEQLRASCKIKLLKMKQLKLINRLPETILIKTNMFI